MINERGLTTSSTNPLPSHEMIGLEAGFCSETIDKSRKLQKVAKKNALK